MAIYSTLICLLCVSVIINKVHGRSITMRRMKRCEVNGVNIVWNKSRHSRSLRTTVEDDHWIKKTITYEVLNKPQPHPFWVSYPDMSQERVEELVRQAFAEWAPHCGLRFERWDGSGPRADALISFEHRDHGDEIPFRGPGGQLAHADYPNEDGVAVHFDDDEIWVDYNPSSSEKADSIQSFYPILLHEIGHALGLPHSFDQDSIMYAFENSHVQHLAASDILNMRNLYGITEELPTFTSSEGVPTTTTSEEIPTTTASEEIPTTTASEVPTTTASEVPTTTAPEKVSTTIASEVPTTTASEVPTTTASEEIATTTASEEAPTTTASEVPTNNASEEIPTTTESEVPTTTASEVPTTTAPEKVSTTIASEVHTTIASEVPTTTAPEKVSTTTASEEVPTTTASEVPTTTAPEKVSTTIASEVHTTIASEVPTTTASEEVPTTTASKVPTTTASEEVPTTTASKEVPTTTASEELTTATSSSDLELHEFYKCVDIINTHGFFKDFSMPNLFLEIKREQPEQFKRITIICRIINNNAQREKLSYYQ